MRYMSTLVLLCGLFISEAKAVNDLSPDTSYVTSTGNPPTAGPSFSTDHSWPFVITWDSPVITLTKGSDGLWHHYVEPPLAPDNRAWDFGVRHVTIHYYDILGNELGAPDEYDVSFA